LSSETPFGAFGCSFDAAFDCCLAEKEWHLVEESGYLTEEK
jgi:hypothetical protein